MIWYMCESCEVEFRIISDCGEYPCYCPYCGSEYINKLEEDDLEED